MKQILTLENLSCQHCLNRTRESLLTLEGVSEVIVNLETQQAEVITDRIYSRKEYQTALAKTIYKVVHVETK